MELTFETTYNQKAMTTMARALRKTVRKKHSRRSQILGWLITVLALLQHFFLRIGSTVTLQENVCFRELLLHCAPLGKMTMFQKPKQERLNGNTKISRQSQKQRIILCSYLGKIMHRSMIKTACKVGA